ncbi:HNH endonuclease signature motif containing protein, partial [Cryobacterium sp. RTC2.1]
GPERRYFNRAQRRAITARDGGCIIPGCKAPAHWAEVHHVKPWAKDGPTNVDNGVLLCWFHHHTIDTSGWEIRMVKGSPQVRAPGLIDPQRL